MLYYKKVLVGAAVMTLAFTTLAGCKGGNEAESSAMVSSAVSSLDEQPQKADLSNSAMLGNSYLDGFVTTCALFLPRPCSTMKFLLSMN